MAKKIDYPAIKKVLWRFARFIGDTAVSALSMEVLLKATNMDLESGAKYLIIIVVSALLSAGTKWLREQQESYESIVHKLPV